MDNNWLQYAPASNKLKQTYVRGFMDISGNVIIRGTGGLKITGGNVVGITKSMVGLSEVDNTSDTNKPISTAQQTALDLKAPLASPTFTGIVTIPATSITNTTESTSTTTGALLVAGGVGIGGSVNIGGNTRISGGLTVDGSLNVTGNIVRTDIQSKVYISEQVDVSNSGTGPCLIVRQFGEQDIAAFYDDANQVLTIKDGGDVSMNYNLRVGGITYIKDTTDSTSTTTGALQVVGGAGIGGNLYVGGTTVGITQAMVGLGNVDNTSDASKPISTAQQSALDLKAPIASPTFTGTVGGITKTMVGLGNLDNTSDANKPVSTAQQTALDLKATIASPTFTGTVTAPATVITNTTDSTSAMSGALQVVGGASIGGNLYVAGTIFGITNTMVGLSNIDNTSDANKPVSTAQQAALDLKATIESPTFTGTVTAPATSITNTTDSVSTTTGALQVAGGVGIGGNLYVGGTIVGITKSMAGLSNVDNTSDVDKPISTSQQTAIDLRATIASPTFTGTITTPAILITNTSNSTSTTTGALQVVGGAGIGGNLYVGGTTIGITKTMVGLGNVDDTSDANKPVSTAQQTALDLKAPIASPTFTGTVGGITKSMVGLGNVDNTSDVSKPVSTSQQTALDLKANLASPTFTGTVSLPVISITNTTASTSNTTGALKVVGGAGIGGNAYIGEAASIGGSCKIGTSSLLKMLVAVSDNGEIYSSSDGIIWTDTNGGIGGMNACIKYNGTYWIGLSKQYGAFIKSYDGVTWTPDLVNTIPANTNFEFDWNGAYWLGAYFNNDSVTILTSTNGLNWTGTNGSGIDAEINSVIWIPTLSKWFITYISELRYTTSSNGINWTIYEEASSWDNTYYLNGDENTNISSNAYIPSKLKLGGSDIIGYSPNNNAIYSSDGITWIQTNFLSGTNVDTIDYNGTIWMGISYNGISTSLDGITWTSVHTFDVNELMIYSSIIQWTGTYWLTYSTEGTMKSTDDGVTWTLVDNTTLSFLGIELGSVTATVSSNNTTTGALVVSGGVGIEGNMNIGGNMMASGIITINNAMISTSTTTGAVIVNGGVGIGGNAYIGKNTFVGEICKIGLFSQSSILLGVNANNEIYISNDGIDWSTTNFQFPNIDDGIRYNGVYWIAFSRYFNSFVKSYDGVTWDTDSIIEQNFGPVNTTFEFEWNGLYWLGAYAGTLLKSTDGINWTNITTKPDINSVINSVIWIPTISKWIITYASNYKYATSSNGIDWTIYEETSSWLDTSGNNGQNSNTISPGYVPSKLKLGGSKIVGYINSGYLIYSTDGINWSNSNMVTTTYPDINDFIYWNGANWLFMNDDGFFTSPDLITWTPVYTFSATSILTVDTPFIRWFGTYWLAYDNSERIFKSENNGVTWTLVNISYNIDFTAIEFGYGSVSIMSSNSSNGALIVSGGAGISGDINVGRNLNVSGEIKSINTTDSTSTTTGALMVSGGVGIQGNLYVGGTIVGGITKSMVGLANVNNTSDANKPVSTAQQTALDLKANLASPTFTGTITTPVLSITNTIDSTSTTSGALQVAGGVGIGGNLYVGGTTVGITKSMVGLSNVDDTSDTAKPVSTAQQTALDLKANLASPTFTGTVGGITKSMVGLGNVDDTSDTAKPVSTAQQTALDLKANLTSPTFTGTVTVPATSITNTTVSTNTSTGALIVGGGAGIVGDVNVGGNIFLSTGNSVYVNGVILSTGGGGGGSGTSENLVATSTTASTSTATGALQVVGGAGIGGNAYVGGNIIMTNTNNGNTRFGYQALPAITTGADNTVLGYNAGLNITSNNSNIAIGRETLTNATNSRTGGNNNVLIGNYSGRNINGSSSGNVGIGSLAIGGFDLALSTTGTQNTAVGYAALRKVTSASNNVCVGYQTLSNITTGGDNVAIGVNSGQNQTTGSSNTFIGRGADGLDGIINSTAIGQFAYASESNQIVLGTSSQNVSIPGNILLNSGKGIYVNGNGIVPEITTVIDFTGTLYNTSSFYIIEIIPPTSMGVSILTTFFITGESQGGGMPHNEVTLYGAVRTGGWSDHNLILEVTQRAYDANESRFYGIYTGSRNYQNIIVYARGGYRYSVTTNGTIGYYPTPGNVGGVPLVDADWSGFIAGITESGGLGTAATGMTSLTPTNQLNVTGYLLNSNSTMNRTIRSEGFEIQNAAVSNSTASGALMVAGGVGVGGNVFAGGRMNAVTFNSTSDSRIKNNIISIDGKFAVDKLRQLEPCTYSLIEQPIERTYGFIAQEISKVLPEAVSLTTNCVPSIYEFAFVEGNKITLVNKTIDLSWKRVKVVDKVLDIVQVVDDKTFYVSTYISVLDLVPVDIECRPLVENLGQYKYKNGEIYTGIVKSGAFIYGNEIDDFHMLDKDVIWAVTTRATQELDRQLQEAKQTIRNQDARILNLEEEIALIKQHIHHVEHMADS